MHPERDEGAEQGDHENQSGPTVHETPSQEVRQVTEARPDGKRHRQPDRGEEERQNEHPPRIAQGQRSERQPGPCQGPDPEGGRDRQRGVERAKKAAPPLVGAVAPGTLGPWRAQLRERGHGQNDH